MQVVENGPGSTKREEQARTKLGGEPLKLAQSEILLERARRLVPGVTQSWMKRPEMFAPGSYPVFVEHGEGALVRDVDGQSYIDYICGLGANTLGHNHPAIVGAILSSLGRGLLHSLPTPIELDAAQDVVDAIPGAEMARFFKTGADATSAAVRLARHLTGKQHMVTVGYNGWHDHFMFDTKGVPAVFREYSTRMPLLKPEDDEALLAMVDARGDELALVLLSLPYNRRVPAESLHRIRERCRKKNVLFVLDEVVTGFRLALGGAQELYGIDADFVCLSKGIAAGMPLSALAGPRRTLEPLAELQVSTTFGGEVLSLACCRAAIEVYRSSDYFSRIAALGQRLADGINGYAERQGHALRIVGHAAIPLFRFSEELPKQAKMSEAFLGAMARRGVILRRDLNFISGVHTEEQVDFTIAASQSALKELAL